MTRTTKIATAILSLAATSLAAPIADAAAGGIVVACPGDVVDDTCLLPSSSPAEAGGAGTRVRARVVEKHKGDAAHVSCTPQRIVYVACAE
jgi:hypothetical protein